MLKHTHTLRGPQSSDPIADRSSVTELSRLTSDPILTADRRGGILISFGLNHTPSGVQNPFGPRPSDPARRPYRPPATCSLRSHPNRPIHIRPSDHTHAENHTPAPASTYPTKDHGPIKGHRLHLDHYRPSTSTCQRTRTNSTLRAGTQPEGT